MLSAARPAPRLTSRLCGLVAGLATVVASTVVLAGPAHAVPGTRYEMPFPCGQQWTGSSRASHSPSSLAIDWNRTNDIGDQVVAAAPGKVTTANAVDRGGYGRYVVITHANGESTLYAHLQSIAVRLGQSVDQGTLVGAVGESGNVTGPHLHFEEKRGSRVFAPYLHGTKFVFPSSPISQNCVDVPMAGNFLGKAPAELVVYRRAAASTFRINRPGTTPRVVTFGTSTDQPVIGDWDGSGKVNVGVRTPSTSTFKLSTPKGVTSIAFGAVADQPVAGDWDGNGTWEIGIRKAGTNVFRLRAANGAVTSVALGDPNDLPVTGDWDGDKRTDLGVYDSATAMFTLRRVDSDGIAWTAQVPFGRPGDLPVAGDWDGNGRTDVGVWNPGTAVFSQRRATSPLAARSTVRAVPFGTPRPQ